MADRCYSVLVTGASGFIGRALVPALVGAGHRVRAASRSRLHVTDAESVTLPDITRPVDWMPLVDGIDIVVHLAGIAHRQAKEDADYDQAIRRATADLAAACHNSGVKRLIFMSSIGAQAGSAFDGALTEIDTPRPVTDYDRAKLAAEESIRQSGIAYTILRPVIVYGPHPKANIALLAKLAALPTPLPFGGFKNRRSLLAVDNLIAAVMNCLDGTQTMNQTFVVSDPEPMTLATMLATMRRARGRSPGLFHVPPALFKLLLFATGRSLMWDRIGRDLIVDPQKLRDAGWKPVVTTEQGLGNMVGDIRLPKK